MSLKKKKTIIICIKYLGMEKLLNTGGVHTCIWVLIATYQLCDLYTYIDPELRFFNIMIIFTYHLYRHCVVTKGNNANKGNANKGNTCKMLSIVSSMWEPPAHPSKDYFFILISPLPLLYNLALLLPPEYKVLSNSLSFLNQHIKIQKYPAKGAAQYKQRGSFIILCIILTQSLGLIGI